MRYGDLYILAYRLGFSQVDAREWAEQEAARLIREKKMRMNHR